MKLITAILLFIFIWNVTFSQTESGITNKVKVFIEYSTGKMYSQYDVEGNASSWLGSLSKAPFKESNDTIYFYLIEDVDEYLRMTKNNSMAIVGDTKIFRK